MRISLVFFAFFHILRSASIPIAVDTSAFFEEVLAVFMTVEVVGTFRAEGGHFGGLGVKKAFALGAGLDCHRSIFLYKSRGKTIKNKS